MTSAAYDQELPPASEALLREHEEELHALAARIGVTDLRIARRPGVAPRQVSETTDMLDIARFEIDAEQLLGAGVRLFSDRVVTNENVSVELLDTTPL